MMEDMDMDMGPSATRDERSPDADADGVHPHHGPPVHHRLPLHHAPVHHAPVHHAPIHAPAPYAPPIPKAPAPYVPPPPVHHAPAYKEPARPYQYEYGVADSYSGAQFAETQTQDEAGVVKGSYSVALPDGRTQIVNYHADHHGGYVAEVTYEGTAVYPDHHPAPYHPPAPAPYKPAPKPVYKPAPPVYHPGPALPPPGPALHHPGPIHLAASEHAPVYAPAPKHVPVYRSKISPLAQ